MIDRQLRKLFWREFDGPRFLRAEFHLLRKLNLLDRSSQYAGHGTVGRIGHVDHHRQPSFRERRHIDIGQHMRITQRRRPTGAQFHFLPQPHVLIGRFRRPIDERDRQIVFVRRQHFDIQQIAARFSQRAGDVEFEIAVGAHHTIGGGNFFAVEPNVGAVVDALEIQPRLRGIARGGGIELFLIPPRNGEPIFGNTVQIVGVKQVRVFAAGHQPGQHGRRN